MVRMVPFPPWPAWFISAAHLELRSQDGFCLVVDQWFTKVPVKFEILQLLCSAPQGLNVGISVDLSDAYHHLRIADSIGHLFTFVIDRVCY